VDRVAACFAGGSPAVISIHSINFHSTIRDFRTPTLKLLDELLTTVKEVADLLYVNDADLFSMRRQQLCWRKRSVKVGAIHAY